MSACRLLSRKVKGRDHSARALIMTLNDEFRLYELSNPLPKSSQEAELPTERQTNAITLHLFRYAGREIMRIVHGKKGFPIEPMQSSSLYAPRLIVPEIPSLSLSFTRW